MLHVRLVVPADDVDDVVRELADTEGVVHLARCGTAMRPAGEVVTFDVVREAANDVVERLQDRGVHHDGAITLTPVETVVSDVAAGAAARAPGEAADALVWESLEAKVRDESTITASYLLLMAIAAIIAAIGILLDSAILVIGAMVVGPDYGPLAAVCVALVRQRSTALARAATAVVAGLVVAALGALVATLVFRATSIAPDTYDIGERQLTAFISHPDAMAAVVAVLAGIVGMLSLTQGRSGALIGVLVSVTTIPAVGNVGAAMAYGAWSDVGGAAVQLAVNVAGLVLAGALTLVVQSRLTTAHGLGRRR